MINSVSAGKTNLKENETAKITIYASDPNNEQLEFQSLPGLRKNRKGKVDPNVKTKVN